MGERSAPELAVPPLLQPQRGAENKLFESEQWLRMLIDSAEGYAIFAVNPQGEIATWNRGAEKLFGYAREEILGRDFSMIYTREDREQGVPREEIEHAQREGYSPDARWHRRKDGSRLFVSGAVRPLKDKSGAAQGFLKVAHDITSQKRSEEEIREARDRLAHSNEELEERVRERTVRLTETIQELEGFGYSLSHDMRAPLRAMESFAQILSTDFAEGLGAEGAELLSRIVSSASRLDQLIQDVLTLSRLGSEQITPKPIDLEKLIGQIIRERIFLQPPRAEVVLGTPLLKVVGHEASLTQCLTNLLDNAAKFVAPGVVPRIQVWTEALNGTVRIWVEDNGIGVPKEYQERIFGMFQRLHSNERYPGTGIGLSIVRKAAERMGGKAGVESEPGKGSRFWIGLPGVRET